MKAKVALACIALALVAAGVRLETRRPSDPATVLSSCFTEARGGFSNTCLRDGARSLLQTYSAAALMRYATATSTPANIRAFCHPIAHAIGEETYSKAGSLEAALSSCSNACSYGCVHGVVAAHIAKAFGKEYAGDELAHADAQELRSIGSTYCASSAANCHAVGHIARIASDDLSAALRLCSSIATSTMASEACFFGVFMEDTGDVSFAQRKAVRTDSDYGYPCDTLNAPYLNACYLQLPSYQRQLFEAHGVAQERQVSLSQGVCSALSGERRADCFYGFGYKLDIATDESGTVAHAGPGICDALAGNDSIQCARGLAYSYAAFSRYEDALRYCESRSAASRTKCYEETFEGMAMPRDRIERYCAAYDATHCADALAGWRPKRLRNAQ